MVDGTGKTAGTTPEGRGAARRPMWVVVLLLVLAAGALWGSSRLAWTALVEERPGGAVTVALREGDEHSPALVPLALLALAGIAAVVATGGWVRRVLGALL
ncbi:Trp biosynthesis-associated membrane protein, partial [Streptomyces griseoaurantiacus]